MLFGLIASGKSTYAKQKAEEGWIIINDDSIVNAIHAENYFLYDINLKPLYKSIENHILTTAIAMGRNVLIDRGVDICKESRKRWIAIAKSLDTPIKAVCFEVASPEIHAQRRYAVDSRGHSYDYWLKVAKKHMTKFCEPSKEEGFDEIEHIKWKH